MLMNKAKIKLISLRIFQIVASLYIAVIFVMLTGIHCTILTLIFAIMIGSSLYKNPTQRNGEAELKPSLTNKNPLNH